MEAGIRAGSIDLLVEIADFFGVTMDYLILGKEQPKDLLKKKLCSMIAFLTAMEQDL